MLDQNWRVDMVYYGGNDRSEWQEKKINKNCTY